MQQPQAPLWGIIPKARKQHPAPMQREVMERAEAGVGDSVSSLCCCTHSRGAIPSAQMQFVCMKQLRKFYPWKSLADLHRPDREVAESPSLEVLRCVDVALGDTA